MKSPKRDILHKTALKWSAFLSKAAMSFTLGWWGTLVIQSPLASVIHHESPLMQPQGLDIALKSSSMAQARAISRSAEWQWPFQVSLATCRMPHCKGLLWDSKACCDFMYFWGWYFWLTPEMVQFFLLFQSVGFLWQTEMTSSFVVTNSRSHSLFPKHCSLLLDCLLKDPWMICLFCFTVVCLTLGEVFLENSGYC